MFPWAALQGRRKMPPAWKRWAGLRSFWCITSETSSARKHRPAKTTFTFYNLESTQNKTYICAGWSRSIVSKKARGKPANQLLSTILIRVRLIFEMLQKHYEEQESRRPWGPAGKMNWPSFSEPEMFAGQNRSKNKKILLCLHTSGTRIISFFLESSENIHISRW